MYYNVHSTPCTLKKTRHHIHIFDDKLYYNCPFTKICGTLITKTGDRCFYFPTSPILCSYFTLGNCWDTVYTLKLAVSPTYRVKYILNHRKALYYSVSANRKTMSEGYVVKSLVVKHQKRSGWFNLVVLFKRNVDVEWVKFNLASLHRLSQHSAAAAAADRRCGCIIGPDGSHSFSVASIPDVVVEDLSTSVLFFTADWKSTQPLFAAVCTLHFPKLAFWYRDAI